MHTKRLKLCCVLILALLGLTQTAMAVAPNGLSAVADNQEAADVTAIWDFQNVNPASLSGVGIEGSTGTVASTVEGIELTVDATAGKLKQRDSDAQFNENTIIRVPVKNAGDEVTVVSYPGYHNYTIAGVAAEADATTYTAVAADAGNGYVEIVATGSAYLYSITVVQKAPKPLSTLDNEPATATFAFNTGTEGQKADFGEADRYFVTSKVTYGSNLVLKGLDSNGIGQTQFDPLTQQNEGESGTAADESNAIRFLIQPNYGLTFTPKKVTLKTTRFGTDNGLIDLSWENPDKSAVSLAVGVKPARNNETVNHSALSYDIEGATPAEGTCGLLINLYHLQNGKQIGFADVVIEGTLSGTEKEVPVLATLTINGTEYAAEKLFGDAYEATLELSKKVSMVSEINPVTATAKKGELGTITYVGDDTQCAVTVPLTFGETAVEYVLNIVQKPDFKLTYIDTDKQTVLGEFIREKDEPIGSFDIDFATATASEGTKVRGWFTKTIGDVKYTVNDVVTGDMALYAVATEIEEVSNFKKYTFDLTSQLFDPADHEAFNPSGSYYWHDKQHGWALSDGVKIDLLVGPKASVFVTLCRYGSANDIVVTDAAGQQLGTLPGVNTEEVDGEIVAFNYEGEGGTITLNFSTSGEMYLHGVRIVNTAETNYASQGNWYFVKPGDASSFIDVLDVVNGANASKDAERSYIFLPDGVYDLGETVKTGISGHNISIIGQSEENTIIRTAPDKSVEGLGSADMFSVSGTNLYLQDITLHNALDYYGALGGGQVGGRAAVMQDSGNRTVGKRVKMLSYQDTYYSSNSAMQSYYEDCDIHGTVDFICGGGDVRFQNTIITLEPRSLDGSGSRTVVAPSGTVKFGYVFDGCTVVDLANGKGNWNLGRTWNNQPITVYLNTTLDENARKTLVSSRWTEKGMNSKDPVQFGEYNTMDVNGQNITPQSNIIHSHGGDFETILTADQAAGYSYQMMFSENPDKQWDPASLTKQVVAPANVQFDGTTLTWDANSEALCWMILKNGQFEGIATSNSYVVDDPAAVYAVRAANQMGGFGEASFADVTVTLSQAGYATFYDSKCSFALPEGLKAYVVTEGTTDALTYEELAGVIPAGTAVMLEAVNHKAGQYTLSVTAAEAAYTGANLLKGSDAGTVTYADNEQSLYYKLAYGHSGTDKAKVFGWYWGAADGAAFQIEAHRAWLAIPQAAASRIGYGLEAGNTTGISHSVADGTDNGAYYNLQGQRIAAPSKGLYIRDNKKVVVK